MGVLGLSALVGAAAGVAAHLVVERFERWLADRQPEEESAEAPAGESEETSNGS